MANLFEKPIAANPMSTFTALPLQLIDQALTRRENQYNKAKLLMEQAEDELLGTKALAGDRARHQQLVQDQLKQLDSIVDSAVDGDYSRVQGQLDVYKRRLSRELNYGELGAINRAYTAGTKSLAEAQKLYQDKKISKSGFDLALQRINSYQTEQDDAGGFSSFTPYTASNVVNPLKSISDQVDEINAKYSEEGEEYISPELIQSNIMNSLKTRPELQQALGELFSTSGSQESYQDFVGGIISNIVQDKQYYKHADAQKAALSGKLPMLKGRQFMGFQSPVGSEDFGMRGGSVPGIRSMANKLLNLDTLHEFNKSINSKEVQDNIKYIVAKTGDQFPKTFSEQREWIDKHMAQKVSGNLQTRDVTKGEVAQWINDKGQLISPGGMRNREGDPLSADEKKRVMTPTSDGKVPVVVGIIEHGFDLGFGGGSAIIMGTDGEYYIQEPSDTPTLTSKDFGLQKIKSTRYNNSFKTHVTLDNSILFDEGSIPAGNYEVSHILPDREQGITHDSFILSRNGTPVYIVGKTKRESDGMWVDEVRNLTD